MSHKFSLFQGPFPLIFNFVKSLLQQLLCTWWAPRTCSAGSAVFIWTFSNFCHKFEVEVCASETSCWGVGRLYWEFQGRVKKQSLKKSGTLTWGRKIILQETSSKRLDRGEKNEVGFAQVCGTGWVLGAEEACMFKTITPRNCLSTILRGCYIYPIGPLGKHLSYFSYTWGDPAFHQGMGNGEGYQLHIWYVFVVYLLPHLLNNRGSEGPPFLISLDFFF